MSQENMIAGGYTTYSCVISNDAKASFEEATANFTGVEYSPVAVASQVVAGTNYRFFCNARMVIPEPANDAALVTVFQPLPGQGKATITDIRRVS